VLLQLKPRQKLLQVPAVLLGSPLLLQLVQ